MASFGPIAPHYDLLMRQVPYRMWADYLQLLMAQHGAEPKTLLDVCCGTGTMAELLTDDGFTVHGFDLAPAMIERAKKRAERIGKGMRFWVDDAAEFTAPQRYDAAYSVFDSLNYITDPEKLAAAFRRIADALEPGGWLLFDLNTAYAFEQGMFDQQDMRKKADIQYRWKGDYDPSTRIIKVKMTFWRNGESFHEEHVQRAHPLEDVEQMMKESGIALKGAYESYTLMRPGKASDRVHLVGCLEQ